MFYTYILYSGVLGKFYIGSTKDIANRLEWHNVKGHGFTSRGRPWVLEYFEAYETREEAKQREEQLKRWKNSKRIRSLIGKGTRGRGVLPT
ncbi:GIY-YIG nuclease family protein [Saccharicrinis sp. FJH54]|uniref:GIY-YIG nuclease family protein n=1 Tax=Saccharicrinis sp. FJH54 TaxID=3344665 RepID=UPI0035D44EF1